MSRSIICPTKKRKMKIFKKYHLIKSQTEKFPYGASLLVTVRIIEDQLDTDNNKQTGVMKWAETKCKQTRKY